MSSTITEANFPVEDQRALWRRQSASLPSLHGGKRAWLKLIFELVSQVQEAGADIMMNARPNIPDTVFKDSESRSGASAVREPLTWGEYSRFLKAAGLVRAEDTKLVLTGVGHKYLITGSPSVLGTSLAKCFRLLSESLNFIASSPETVEEVDKFLKAAYHTDWKSLGGVRARLDWLDALGAIEATAGRRWMITSIGQEMLMACHLVTPEALEIEASPVETIEPAPIQIKNLLAELSDGTRLQSSRSTYNIWVPSPATHSNKVENLRVIVNALIDPLSRSELLGFIANTFSLRRSSVDSMLPFLRASGLIVEVGLGIYQASPTARAWLQSGSNINFIRILHANMRFVGEMLLAAEGGATRADVYAEAKRHGLNVDKSRWIAAFLMDTGLIVPPKYGSLRTTPTGVALLEELPLAEPEVQPDSDPENIPTSDNKSAFCSSSLAESLDELSRTPMAKERGAGKAFERAISDAFTLMGFDARVLSGSGTTDVLVKWRDHKGAKRTSIVEAKSRSSGSISHTDVSDVALESHKVQHHADYVAVIAPAFVGDTIKNMARARSWTLIDASMLGAIADKALALGIGPELSGALFESNGGVDATMKAIADKQRELAVLTYVVGQLAEEAKESGDPITPRDISRDGRRSEVKPSVSEVLSALSTLQDLAPGAVRKTNENNDPKFSSFELGSPRSSALGLRAIAEAIEAPL